MGNCRNEYVRRVVKTTTTAGVIPTIPTSDNHKDGSWIATDIYKGELFFNLPDGIMYTRDDTGIVEIQTQPAGYGEWIALITQSGTNAPTASVIKDTIGGITLGYNAVGQYTLDADAGSIFSSGNAAGFVGSFDSINDRGLLYRLDDDTMRLDTFVSTTPTNGVLTDTLVHIRVILP